MEKERKWNHVRCSIKIAKDKKRKNQKKTDQCFDIHTKENVRHLSFEIGLFH